MKEKDTRLVRRDALCAEVALSVIYALKHLEIPL